MSAAPVGRGFIAVFFTALGGFMSLVLTATYFALAGDRGTADTLTVIATAEALVVIVLCGYLFARDHKRQS